MDCVKGFKDIPGEEALRQEKIKEILIRIFKLYGFEPAETPIIEYEEFVRGENPQDEAVSETFELQDRGKRKLALRYEFTFQLKRLAKGKKLPYKRYQIGAVFRDEPTSANRFRQFTQCDIDTIGSTIRDDAEILALTSDVLKKLGISAKININNRKLLNEILDKNRIRDREAVMREVDKLDKLPENEVRANLKKYNAENLLGVFKKPESYFKRFSTYKEIAELRKYCSYFGVKINFQPSLARGLSYYTGSVFEIKTEKMKETIIGGGSYLVDGLQATGISFGLERLSPLANVSVDEKKVLLISLAKEKQAIKLAQQLRSAGIACLMMDKLSKGLDYADSKKIPYVLFLGEKELKAKKVKLRDMKTGKEQLLSIKEVIRKLIKL